MADNVEEAKADIFGLMNTTWAASAPTGAVLNKPNIKEQRPDDALWGRVWVRMTEGDRAALGKSRFREVGIAGIQIFTPVGQGTQTADVLTHALKRAFEEPGAVGNVWFRRVRSRDVGLDEAGVFFQTNFEFEFQFDRTE